MSSILKALHKLEQDKSTIGEGNVDIAHDILKRRHENTSTHKLWQLAVLTGGGLAVIGALVYSLPQSNQPIKSAIKPLPPAANTAGIAVKPATEASAPIIKQVAKIEDSDETSLPKSIPELVVTKIIYHQQPEARLAIINDFPVMEATWVEKVKVVEIMPDRVRFIYQGVDFIRFVKGSGKRDSIE